jgi:hypothetical protein
MLGPETLQPGVSAAIDDVNEDAPGDNQEKLGPAALISAATSRGLQMQSRPPGKARINRQFRGRVNRIHTSGEGPQPDDDQCKYCLQHGHWKAGCPQWRAYRREHARGQPAAHTASHASNPNVPSGCSPHDITTHTID